MKIKVINTWNGGMTADPRDSASHSQLCKHFDNFTKSHTLTPYRSSEAAYDAQADEQLQTFLMHGSSMYAIGIVPGTTRPRIKKNSNIATPSWSSPANGDGPTVGATFKLFIEYHDVFYGSYTGVPGIWAYNPASTTFTSPALSVGPVNDPVGIVDSKDDILYIGFDNKIIKKDNASGATETGGWTNPALTLPANLVVMSMCELGNFIAIACRSKQQAGHSKVFLWNRDSTLMTLSESIDLGNKVVQVIEEIDGYLIAVSITSTALQTIRPKMVFSSYSGGGFVTFKEIFVDTLSQITGKQKANNRLYFGFSGSSYGYTEQYDYTGIWSVGRNGALAPFSVNFAQLPNNGTGGPVELIKGFIIVGDYFYISYQNPFGTLPLYGLSKTDDLDTYAATSVYITTINPDMDPLDKVLIKKLAVVGLTYDRFPVSGVATLRYKVDRGSMKKAFDELTPTQVTEMPQDVVENFDEGREFTFQIESTRGVEISALFYGYEPNDSLLHK